MEKRRVVVTGIGIVSPLGNSVSNTWEAATAGRSGIGPITQFDASDFSVKIVGEIKDFDPAEFMSKKDLKKVDRFSQFAVAASKEAWEASGIEDAGYDPVRMGCLLGVGIGGLGSLEKYHQAYLESGPRKISPFLIPLLVSNLGAGHLGIQHNLKGINLVTSSACASSTHAMGEAYRLIMDGLQDVVVTGGAESTVCPSAVGGFASMRALSTRNDEPEKASRPFDKDRDGFVLSEGSAIMIFEEMEAAKKRNAPIYAEVLGYGFSCDANHITAPCADGSGAAKCMKMAIESAGLNAEDIQYVNAHGTSTPVGDVAETKALKQVFGSYSKEGLVVSSTKSMTGHLLGAAGALEAAFCTLSITEGVIPPTINLDNPDPECDLDYAPFTSREKEITRAMSNSFGFGGTNASIILGAV